MKFNFKYLELEFIESAAEFNQCLHHDMQEIAFVGASNAGKSSAINAISNQKNLPKLVNLLAKQSFLIFLKQKMAILLISLVMGIQRCRNLKKRIGLENYQNTFL